MRARLLAIDMDGTLLRNDGTLGDEDRSAIARALRSGLQVTLATGRVPVRTLPWACALGLDAPLICADGAITLLATNGAVRNLVPLSVEERQGLLELSARTGMPALFLTPEVVVGGRADAGEARAMSDWSPAFEVLEPLSDVLSPELPIVSGFLMGTAEEVAHAATLHAQLEPLAQGQMDFFEVIGRHTLRVRPPGTDKGTALAALAATLGLERDEVAAVGDWYNDVPMLRWATHSFVMGQAPEAVAQVAKRRLVATAAHGGGVAEVIAALLERQ